MTKAEASSQRKQYANNSAFAEKETVPSLKSEANALSFKQYRQNSAAQSALSVAQTAHSISWVVGVCWSCLHRGGEGY
ncbi:MAG: hypothetical protein ACKERG_03965 [Candidatus Hodgkinia cicadicola]